MTAPASAQLILMWVTLLLSALYSTLIGLPSPHLVFLTLCTIQSHCTTHLKDDT